MWPSLSAITPADVTFPYDYDRDGEVNATDVLLARNNQTSFLNAVELIDLSVAEAAVSPPELAWFAEFAEARSTKTPDPAGDAVDKVLATYWP